MRQRMKSWKTWNVYSKLLLIIVCMTIIPSLLISSLSYQVSINNAKHQAKTYSLQLLVQLRDTNDILYEQMQAFLNELLLNYRRYHDIIEKAPYTSEVLTMYRELDQKRTASQSSIHAFYLIEPSSQKAYSSIGRTLYSFEQFPDQELLSLVNRNSGEESLKQFIPRQSRSSEPVVSYMMRYRLSQDSYGYIVIDVSMKKFLNLSTSSQSKYGYLFLRNANNRLLNVEQEELANAINDEEKKKHYYFMETSSSYSGLSYTYAIPKSYIQRNNQTLMYSITGVAALVLLLGLLAAWRSSRNLYSPLSHLLHTIQDLAGDQTHERSEMNEFRYIESAVHKLHADKASYWKALQTNENIIKQRQLGLLLSGNIRSFREMAVPDDMKLVFTEETFFVYVIELDEPQSFKQKYTVYEQELILFAMENIAAEIMKANENGLLARMEPLRLIGLVNDSTAVESQNEMFNALMKAVHSYLNIAISIAVGTPVEGVEFISYSFEKANAAASYRVYLGKNAIIYYDQLPPQRVEPLHKISWIEVRDEIKQRLQADRWDELREYVEDVVTKSSHLNMTLGDLYIIYLQFITCITVVGHDVSVTLDIPDRSAPLSFGERLKQMTTVDELREQMLLLAYSLFDQMEQKKANIHKDMIDKVLHFIQTNVHQNLTVELLANRVHLHPSYLSKICKDATGKSLGEHIVDIRIQRAKELLIHSSISVNDISEKIGYANPRAFYRMFKEYTGLTPGQFRKLEDTKGLNGSQ